MSTFDHKRGLDRKLIVRSVAPNSPAETAGLKPGDVITKIGHNAVVDCADLERSMLGRNINSLLDLSYRREDKSANASLALASNPRGTRQNYAAAKPALPPAVAPSVANAAQPATMPVPPAPVVAPIVTEKSWEILGLKLTSIPNGTSLLANQPYRGGLLVTEVRSTSPADSNGIKKGDVLVGLHVWETVKHENVDYVLEHQDLKTINPLKFYILRAASLRKRRRPCETASLSGLCASARLRARRRPACRRSSRSTTYATRTSTSSSSPAPPARS